MIMVEVNSDDECQAVIDKTLNDGHCAILCTSIVGILVFESKKLAAVAFQKLVSELALALGEEGLPIFGFVDARGIEGVGVVPGTPGTILLYGIPHDEVVPLMDIQRAN